MWKKVCPHCGREFDNPEAYNDHRCSDYTHQTVGMVNPVSESLRLLRNAYDSARQQAAGDGNARAESYWLGAMRGVDDAPNMKPPRYKSFWVIFLKDPATGVITGTAHSHNAKAYYKDNPYYLGTHKIEVDMEKLK